MKFTILRNLCTAVVTLLFFAVISGLIIEDDYHEFTSVMSFCLIIGAPPIFLFGIPFSLVIDKLLNRLNIKRNAVQISVSIVPYAVAGFVGTWIYFVILISRDWRTDIYDIMPIPLFGVLAALLFLFFKYLFTLVFKKANN